MGIIVVSRCHLPAFFFLVLFISHVAVAETGFGASSAMSTEQEQILIEEAALARFFEEHATADTRSLATIGGDDRVVAYSEDFGDSDIDIAENGDIYVAVEAHDADFGHLIKVFRAVDGQDVFTQWGVFRDATGADNYYSPSIEICEGTAPRLVIAYKVVTSNQEYIGITRALLSDDPAQFSGNYGLIGDAAVDYEDPDLCSDDDTHLFLVATGVGALSKTIVFTRSLDSGASWLTPYSIGVQAFTGRYYANPDVSLGYGGYVHVVWEYGIFGDDYDSGLRYRRGPSYGNDGADSWGPTLSPASVTNGIYEKNPQIAASPTSTDVAISCWRWEEMENGAFWVRDPGFAFSANQGTSFDPLMVVPQGIGLLTEMRIQTGTSQAVMVGLVGSVHGMQKVNLSNHVWGARDIYSDANDYSGTVNFFGVAFDPTRGNRSAIAWPGVAVFGEDPNLLFDAEWRRDPGFPNFAEGSPVELAESPLSAPAAVDLDADGDLEIVFAVTGGLIYAYHHDGTVVDGWPVNVGTELSRGPVAAGELAVQGPVCVVAGTANGNVVCYDGAGQVRPGFPSTIEWGKPAYVSIGALGGLRKGTIVVGCGRTLQFIDDAGEVAAGSYPYFYDYSHQEFQFPAAIGDIDNDGINEVVFTGGDLVTVKRMFDTSRILELYTGGGPASDAITLGDLDLDGDLEIAIPWSDGRLLVREHQGGSVPGFPLTTSSDSPPTSAAWSDIVWTSEPELVFATEWQTVEGVVYTGATFNGFPISTNSYSQVQAAPVIGKVGHPVGSILFAGTIGYLRCWINSGSVLPGWPKYVNSFHMQSPIIKDLDADGYNEVVYLNAQRLAILEVNAPVDRPRNDWAMYGYDSQRSGCFDCPDLSMSSVPDEDGSLTRVTFATPSPNPTAGKTLFAFEIPILAQVRLDVFDLRGHRVRTVVREETPAGQHVVGWDGRGEKGRALSSGVYFARLQVRGPGVDWAQTRKVNMLR